MSAHSQLIGKSQPDDKTYVVTDSVRNGVRWNFLRTLDQRTGAFSNILARLLNNNEMQPPPGTPSVITCNGVAAIALDQKNKRLYYTPMLTDRLYYIDLRTMNKYIVTNHFTGLMPKAKDQSNIITRMVIAGDNKGYALTNDGKHLIRFRTNNSSNDNSVTDLGSLADAPGNNEMSVHNLCSSFGGDLIADDDDHLYLITAGNHVYKINIQTRIAKYKGTVTNLPAGFTTSSAAAEKSGGKITLVSSVDSTDVYSLNLTTLIAKRLNANRPWFSSDLANGVVLESGDHNGHDNKVLISANENNDNIQLYPNPVTSKEFKIHFTDVRAGIYRVIVTDAEGKSILSKTVSAGGKDNIFTIALPKMISGGIYIVRISDSDNKPCYSGKIFVQ